MLSRIGAALHAAFALPKPVDIPSNVERISNIPYALLPDMSAVRDDLLAVVYAGKDVDAYIPAGLREWVIWCKPEDPKQNGRYSVEQWKAIHEREYYRLMPVAPRRAEEGA